MFNNAVLWDTVVVLRKIGDAFAVDRSLSFFNQRMKGSEGGIFLLKEESIYKVVSFLEISIRQHERYIPSTRELGPRISSHITGSAGYRACMLFLYQFMRFLTCHVPVVC